MSEAGNLEPSGTPGPTMKTLDDIYKSVAPLPTGFVLCETNTRFAVCDEGSPTEDFDDVVLYRATGLMWVRNAILEKKAWEGAIDYCDSLSLGRKTDWRLPTIEELTSLSGPFPSEHHPALPVGHPFVNVQSSIYWSSTSLSPGSYLAWVVNFENGGLIQHNKEIHNCVWCVRGRL